jgi:hypothetical protein
MISLTFTVHLLSLSAIVTDQAGTAIRENTDSSGTWIRERPDVLASGNPYAVYIPDRGEKLWRR